MKGYASLYASSCRDPEAFWGKQLKRIEWFESPHQILSAGEDGSWRWFEGGILNTCYLAVDRHVEQGRGDKVALYYDSPVTGVKRKYRYRELKREVARLAGALQGLGVVKGDRVVIYMPMIPETIFAMLACARIGAVHSVVFGGFAAKELCKRIDDARPKVMLTASCGIEVNRLIPYKPIVDEALASASHVVGDVVVFQRQICPASLQEGRDLDWQAWVGGALEVSCVPVAATDPLYILYTSGTTGRPKGVVRDNGGHAVALDFSMRAIYDMKPGEVFWAASDVGWVVGHSYIVYAPLIHGCATVLYEGKPVRTPDAGAFWRVVEEYGVKTLFTAPTACRAIVKEDPESLLSKKYDLSSLKYLFLAGERCDSATLRHMQKALGIPVIDHWWQTESGWPMLANMAGAGLFPIKPGSAGKPVCGYEFSIVDEAGDLKPIGEDGILLARYPLPPGALSGLWEDGKRFRDSYLKPYPGFYFTGDGAHIDEDGYIYIVGRLDDVINVAGHRLSTATLEECVSSHPAVAECAVVGVEDQLKGQVPLAVVVPKSDCGENSDTLAKEIIQLVRDSFGHVAALGEVLFAERLPKTRSGKILRAVLRAIADGRDLPSVSTIEDASVIDEMVRLFERSHVVH